MSFHIHISQAHKTAVDATDFTVHRGDLCVGRGTYRSAAAVLTYSEALPGPSKGWIIGEVRKAIGLVPPAPPPPPASEAPTLPPPPPEVVVDFEAPPLPKPPKPRLPKLKK